MDGPMNFLKQAVIAFGIIGIVLAVVFSILTQVQATQVTGAAGCNSTVVTNCSTAYNGTNLAINGTYTIAQWLPIIAIVIAASVILVLVFSYMGGSGMGGRR